MRQAICANTRRRAPSGLATFVVPNREIPRPTVVLAARRREVVMAWGFRRSLRLAGPLRLNLSKSGLGLSLGVPGLHVGVGPRGRYVRAGIPGTGVYYRKSLNKP